MTSITEITPMNVECTCRLLYKFQGGQFSQPVFSSIWKHYPTGKWMSAAFRRPDTVVAAAAQSRARTPGTSSTGQETTKALLV